MKKINIGFVCVHNSCRSIMAEAICRKKYPAMFNVYSAGIIQQNHVNQDALATLKRNYHISGDFNSKLVDTLPKLDILITMGCNVECPFLPCTYREDFDISDPSHKNNDIFDLTAKIIELKIDILVLKINHQIINIK